MLTLRTLGRLELFDGERRLRTPRVREAALLVYIAASGERGVRREFLAEMFWPASSQAHALHSLSQALYRLIRDSPGLALDSDRFQVRVARGVLCVDVLDFRAAMRNKDYSIAGALFGGAFLPGLSGDGAPEVERWVEESRREILALAREMYGERLTAAERRGDWDGAYAAATGLLQVDPYDQIAAATEIGLLLAHGARAEAASRYEAVLAQVASIGGTPCARLRDLGVALRAESEPEASPSGLIVPFIGRRREFARLASALADAQAGCGSTVGLIGRAGVGKTRLCEQLLRLAAIRGFRRITASCAPFEEALPYSAVERLLTWLAPPDRAGISPATLRLLAHMLPHWDHSPGASLRNEPPPREAIFGALTSLFRSLASRSPVLMIVEDVHWLDELSCAYIESLAGLLKDARMVLVLTARSEHLAALPSAKRRVFDTAHRVQLCELDQCEVDELLATFNKTARRRLRQADAAILKRRAGGHPFFLMELLRQFERDGLDIDRGAELPIPDPIGQFLGARFEILTEPASRVADALAVLGGTAGHDALQAVAEVTGERFADAVDELLRDGHVRESDGCVAFLHDLVREAAYMRLSTARKKILHARAAKALRTVRGIDFGILALHARLADNREMAYRYAMAAGSRAEARYGHSPAERFWRMAEEQAPTPRAQARAREALANCLEYLGHQADARQLYLQLLDESGSDSKKLLYRARTMAIRVRLGEHVSLAEVKGLLDEANLLTVAEERLAAFQPLVFIMLASGALGLGGLMEEISATANATKDSWRKVIVLANLADACALNGCWQKAEKYSAAAMASARSYPYLVGVVHSTRAVRLLLRGDLRQADKEFSLAYGHLFEGEYEARQPNLLTNWGIAKTELGDFDGARSFFTRALEMASGEEIGYTYPMAASNYALAEYESGRTKTAAEYAGRTLAVVGDIQGHLRATAGAVLGLIALKDDLGCAEQYRRTVLSGMPPNWAGTDLSYAHIFLARMDERDGDQCRALKRIERGIAFYANRDFFCHGRLELEKARLVAQRDRDAALALSRKVRARALDAGAVLLLNRSEELMRALKHAPAAGDSESGPPRRRGGRAGQPHPCGVARPARRPEVKAPSPDDWGNAAPASQ